jgi:ABC-2 type transport system ATP-binding protein
VFEGIVRDCFVPRNEVFISCPRFVYQTLLPLSGRTGTPKSHISYLNLKSKIYFYSMSISVEALTKVYGVQKAVDGISFTAQPGVLGFLGPNGAGKSTTMKILTGFIPQTSGTASVCGFDVVKQPLEVKRRIGYLPESNPLYTDMYVKESLGFVAGIHKIHEPAKRIADIIEQTGLGPEQHKKIGQLSKGYRQRVGLAQAMLHNPKVLILDEPTSGLDPNQLIEIRQLILDLGKTKTIVLSTHIMQEVEAVCSQVIIINKGTIVANDSLQQLRKSNGGKSLEEVFISLTNN